MDDKIKLHNRGLRTFPEYDFKPNEVKAFPKEIAEKLLRLFNGEVFDLEQTVSVFEAAEVFEATEETQEEVQEEKTEEKPRGRGRPAKA